MLQLNHPVTIQPQLSSLISKEELKATAEQYKNTPVPHITDEICSRSPGTIHDFYSEGDYWWPDPQMPDGLPYIRRDGQTNPENFTGHRLILRRMRNQVSTLALCWKVTGDPSCAQKAVQILQEFFVDESTKMNPHLNYAQAIAGICPAGESES